MPNKHLQIAEHGAVVEKIDPAQQERLRLGIRQLLLTKLFQTRDIEFAIKLESGQVEGVDLKCTEI